MKTNLYEKELNELNERWENSEDSGEQIKILKDWNEINRKLLLEVHLAAEETISKIKEYNSKIGE